MVSIATALPELVDFGVCQACGQEIGWVTVRPGETSRPVDPEPREFAEYALLRNGRTAVNLRHPGVDPSFETYDGSRFWDHAKTCPVPSMRTARSAVGQYLGYVDDVYSHNGRPSRVHEDPAREARRANLVRADQRRDRDSTRPRRD